MKEYSFEGDYKNKLEQVKVKLLLIHFEDENHVHFIYSPHLDLTGYGKDETLAKESFNIVLTDFIDYTLKKKTLAKVLEGLGWQLSKGTLKKPRKMVTPSIKSIINKNDWVSEIMDTYHTNTFHQEVGMPAYM